MISEVNDINYDITVSNFQFHDIIYDLEYDIGYDIIDRRLLVTGILPENA